MQNDFKGNRPYVSTPQSHPAPRQSGVMPAQPSKTSSNSGGILAGLRSDLKAFNTEVKEILGFSNQTMSSYAPGGNQTNPGYRQSPVIYQSQPYAGYLPQPYAAVYPQQHQAVYPQQHQAAYPPQHQAVYPPQHQAVYPQQHKAVYPQQHQAAYPPQYQAVYPQQRQATYQQQSVFPGPGELHHSMTAPPTSTRPTAQPVITAHEKLSSSPIFLSSNPPTYKQPVSASPPEKSASRKAAATLSTNEVIAPPVQPHSLKTMDKEERQKLRIKLLFHKLENSKFYAEAYDAHNKLDKMKEELTPEQKKSFESSTNISKSNVENGLIELKRKEYKPEEFSKFKKAYINVIKEPALSEEQRKEADKLAGDFAGNEFKLEDIIGNVSTEDKKLDLIEKLIDEITINPEKYGELSNMILDTCSGAKTELETKKAAKAIYKSR